MGYLGNAQAVGVKDASNRAPMNLVTAGAWVVTFTPQVFGQGDADFEVYRGACKGPGGYFETYIETTLYGNGENGRINEFSPANPMFIRRGQTFTMHWSIATGTAPLVVLYLRTPQIGLLG